MRVFLVDDSAMIRQRLKRMLAAVDQIQVIGESGEADEAIEAINRSKPDLVLLDIHLFGGSGIDVLQSVKRHPSPPIVIVLTNYLYSQYRDRCMRAGADYYFVKSAEFQKVVPTLRQLASEFDSLKSVGAPAIPDAEGGDGTPARRRV